MNTSIKAKGYIVGAIAAASYGTNPLFALPLYSDGMNPDSVLFFRYLIAIPIMAVMLFVRRGKDDFVLRGNERWQLPVMGILMAMSSLTLFLSYNYMDAGIASTLLFVYPIMVAVIMACCFHEKLSLTTGICICVALSGISLLVRNTEGATLSVTGIVLVMLSSLSYAIYIVGVNQSGLRNVPTLKVIFYVLVFGLALFAARFLAGSGFTFPLTPMQWLNLLGLAVLPTALSFLCTTYAIHIIGPTPTAILGALEPVTAVIIGVCVFGEVVTPRILTGILLIIMAVTLVVADDTVTGHLTHVRKLFPRKKHKS